MHELSKTGLALLLGFLALNVTGALAQDSYQELAFRVQKLRDAQATAALETLKSKGVFGPERREAQTAWVAPTELELTYKGTRPVSLADLALFTSPAVAAQMRAARTGTDCLMRLVSIEENRFESADPSRPLFGSRLKFLYEGQNRSGESREGSFEVWLESPLRESMGRGMDRQSELVLASMKVAIVTPFKAEVVPTKP